RRRRAAPERAPPRLQARDRLRRTANRRRVGGDEHRQRGSQGIQGRGRATVRADGRSGGERRRSCARRSRATLADDTRAGLGGGRRKRRRAVSVTSFVTAGTVDEALAAMSLGARAVAGGT